MLSRSPCALPSSTFGAFQPHPIYLARRIHIRKGQTNALQLNHIEIPAEEPVLKDAPVGDIDALALVRDDNDRPAQRHVAPEVDVAGHGEMVELDDLGDLLEPLLELLNLKTPKY